MLCSSAHLCYLVPDRVTATSISLMALGLGNGVSFLLASGMIRNGGTYGTHSNQSCPNITDNKILSNYSAADVELYREEIGHYMFTMAGPSIALFFLVLVYFPSKPPLPPSISAQDSKLRLMEGVMQVLLNKDGWILMIVNALSQAISGTWGAMMVTNLSFLTSQGKCLR